MTPLELLWSGWRAAYVDRPELRIAPGGQASVFASIVESGLSDEEAHIVHRGRTVFVLMNLFPYSVGHMLVLPYRVVAELDQLDDAEREEMWTVVGSAVAVARTSLGCTGVNVGLNLGLGAGGSVREHLHVHVVPRWVGDANFLTATVYTCTLPEALPDTAAKLRAGWAIATAAP